MWYQYLKKENVLKRIIIGREYPTNPLKPLCPSGCLLLLPTPVRATLPDANKMVIRIIALPCLSTPPHIASPNCILRRNLAFQKNVQRTHAGIPVLQAGSCVSSTPVRAALLDANKKEMDALISKANPLPEAQTAPCWTQRPTKLYTPMTQRAQQSLPACQIGSCTSNGS
ncbi:hypothetical protein SK128_005303 [Halocaridina rubra]|uniref:Uncharacterized protein n=1 Tax=Halocaridina rubra TaxID=373956 RepID=A0AAN8ZU36_HALRR